MYVGGCFAADIFVGVAFDISLFTLLGSFLRFCFCVGFCCLYLLLACWFALFYMFVYYLHWLFISLVIVVECVWVWDVTMTSVSCGDCCFICWLFVATVFALFIFGYFAVALLVTLLLPYFMVFIWIC